MENQEKNQEQNQEQESNQQYIDAIRDLKANTVSKEKYQKLVEENKNLLSSLLTGETVAAATPQEEKKSLMELRRELFNSKKPLSDIEYIEKALELRERVMEEEGEDPFVPKGHGITPTAEGYAHAQRVAGIYKECLEYANGDNQVFINELSRRMADNPIANINSKNRR